MIIASKIDQFLLWRMKAKGSIGFVPTMGAIHDGHISLINSSKKKCDLTVVSIYLNPKQFSKGEDLNNYPISIKSDIIKLKKLDVNILFNPNNYEMYPADFSCQINENKISKVLEGISRPEFFPGVLTIVTKLFNIIRPTHAFFGEKDVQQLRVIMKLVKDLNYPITIVNCPTIRENNGLAMSSRNEYFSKKQKADLSIIYKALNLGKCLLDNGERSSMVIRKIITETLLENSNIEIDYISVANNRTLEEIKNIIEEDILISIAIFYKQVRLIDNIIIII